LNLGKNLESTFARQVQIEQNEVGLRDVVVRAGRTQEAERLLAIRDTIQVDAYSSFFEGRL
jgi:AraC-like DNA-binding protein